MSTLFSVADHVVYFQSLSSTACNPSLFPDTLQFYITTQTACFAFSALFWVPTGWFMPQCGRVRLEKKWVSSFCIFWWRLVLIYSRDTAWDGCAREDSWATLSSNPSTFQRHNSPPLFTSITPSAYSFISRSSLLPSHSQPLSSSVSSPDPTLQPTDRQRFTSSSVHAPFLLVFLSISSSKRT